jgi:hypothetical protein
MPTIPRAYNSAVPGAVPEDEIAAILARLREEVRFRPPGPSADGARLPIRLTSRQDAERLWPVSADRPLQRRSGRSEAFLTPVRTVVRKLVRWYVEPPFADQREFNSTVLALIDDLAERTSAGLERLERAIPGSPDAPEAGPYTEDLRGAAPLLACDRPSALESVEDGSLGSVVLAGADRAPSAEELARALELAAAKLRPGGVLVAEAGGPVAPESAAAIARDAGFGRADVRFGAGAHGYALVARL